MFVLLRMSSAANPSGPRAPSRRRGRSPTERTARGTSAPSPSRVLSSVPSQQPRKPSGIEMMPGLASVNGSGVARVGRGARPHVRREDDQHDRRDDAEHHAVTAPVVLNRRQVSASSSAGKFALAAIANARPTMNETFRPSPPITAMMIAIAPIDAAAILADPDLLLLGVLALADDVRPDVVRHRAGRAEHEARDDGEDRRERDAGDDRQEQVAAERARAAAELEREVRRGEVAARAGGLDAVLAHHGARAEADERREQVEEADDEHRPDDRAARGLRVRAR